MSTAYGSIGQSLIGSAYGVQQASSQQYQMYLQRHASTVTDNEAWLDRRVNEIRVAL